MTSVGTNLCTSRGWCGWTIGFQRGYDDKYNRSLLNNWYSRVGDHKGHHEVNGHNQQWRMLLGVYECRKSHSAVVSRAEVVVGHVTIEYYVLPELRAESDVCQIMWRIMVSVEYSLSCNHCRCNWVAMRSLLRSDPHGAITSAARVSSKTYTSRLFLQFGIRRVDVTSILQIFGEIFVKFDENIECRHASSATKNHPKEI